MFNMYFFMKKNQIFFKRNAATDDYLDYGQSKSVRWDNRHCGAWFSRFSTNKRNYSRFSLSWGRGGQNVCFSIIFANVWYQIKQVISAHLKLCPNGLRI